MENSTAFAMSGSGSGDGTAPLEDVKLLRQLFSPFCRQLAGPESATAGGYMPEGHVALA